MQTLVPIGVAGTFATVLNSLLSADRKATLVYWRIKNALPGHRAFSSYARLDPRINPQRLLKAFRGDFPTDPAEQNAAWYKLYRPLRDDVIVRSAHKVFLLLRDYTALSVFFLIIFGPWSLIKLDSKIAALGYIGLLVVQYLIVRLAASNAGIRMVTSVLALKTALAR